MSTPYGWCPSVLRPMELEDGFMARIRPWLGELSQPQAAGLAEVARSFGAGVIELTNRANIQLRGLTSAEHAAMLPVLDRLELTKVDRTPSARVNVTTEPFRDPSGVTQVLAEALSVALSDAEFAQLPEKFGFLIDSGRHRYMDDVVGDVRIESSDQGLVVRAAGCQTGKLVADPHEAVGVACDLARWFIGSGAIDENGRGRMRNAIAAGLEPPEALTGDALPNRAAVLDTTGPEWSVAPGGILAPDLLEELASEAPLRITPFRAVYVPGRSSSSRLVSSEPSGNNSHQPLRDVADSI